MEGSGLATNCSLSGLLESQPDYPSARPTNKFTSQTDRNDWGGEDLPLLHPATLLPLGPSITTLCPGNQKPRLNMSLNRNWKFFRAGGFDQVRLETGADLLALDQLDQKL